MNLIYLAAEHTETVAGAIFVHGVASYGEEDNAAWAQRYPELMQRHEQFILDVQNPELTDRQRTETQRSLWFDEFIPLMTTDPEGGPALFDRLFGDVEFSWKHADYSNRITPTFEA